MTIRESNSHESQNSGAPPQPSAPAEDQLYATDNNDNVEDIVVQAEPVYPNNFQNSNNQDTDIPFVQATSVVVEQYNPHSSNNTGNQYSSSVATSSASGPIAVATGPARPSNSFATSTGPAMPPPASQQQQQPQSPPAVRYDSPPSRYRDSNGALTCCGISVIIIVSISVCCCLPVIIVVILSAASWNYVTFGGDDEIPTVWQDDKY